MAEKRKRDKVIAEITLLHLKRLAGEQGLHVSREQALVFLNQDSAYEMWKHMMHAGEEFIKRSLFRQCIGPYDRIDASGLPTPRFPLPHTSGANKCRRKSHYPWTKKLEVEYVNLKNYESGGRPKVPRTSGVTRDSGAYARAGAGPGRNRRKWCLPH